MKAATVSTACPFTNAKFLAPKLECLPRMWSEGQGKRGTQCRNEMWPGRTLEPGRASQHRDCSSAPQLPQPYVCIAFLIFPHEISCGGFFSAPRCIPKLSRGWITNFHDGNGGKNAPSFSLAPKWDPLLAKVKDDVWCMLLGFVLANTGGGFAWLEAYPVWVPWPHWCTALRWPSLAKAQSLPLLTPACHCSKWLWGSDKKK